MNNEHDATSTDGGYGFKPSRRAKPMHKLSLMSMQSSANAPRKGNVFQVEARGKVETTDRQGQPLVSKKDGTLQSKIGVKIGPEWYSIYGPKDGDHETIQKGMHIEGKISNNGKYFLFDGIVSEQAPPSQAPMQVAQAATIQAPNMADAFRQRLIVIQTTTKVAGNLACAGKIEDIAIDNVAARLADACMIWAKGGQPDTDEDIPF